MTPKTGSLKTWASALFTALAAVVPMVTVGPLTPTGWTNVGLMILGTLTVAVVPNLVGSVAKYAKAFIAGGTTIGTLLVSFFADGSYALSVPEIMQVVSAALAIVGVYRVDGPLWSGTLIQGTTLRSTVTRTDEP
ncbi:MAG TPA: hypothetical protein VIM60_10405 [Edaphobacter sp.]